MNKESFHMDGNLDLVYEWLFNQLCSGKLISFDYEVAIARKISDRKIDFVQQSHPLKLNKFLKIRLVNQQAETLSRIFRRSTRMLAVAHERRLRDTNACFLSL